MKFAICNVAVVCVAIATNLNGADAEKRAPLLFDDNFEKGADHWQPGNPAVWKVIDTPRGKAYSLFEKDPKFKTAHRSPFTYSLVKEVKVGDFVMEVDGNSTVEEYAHRDLCLFFGFQNAD